MSLAFLAALHGAGLAALHLLALLVTAAHFRRRTPSGRLLPMTVIRPLKGADEGLEENLRSLVEADPGGELELLFAMESADDPAYLPAKRVADSVPGGRARVVITGPSGPRMGKAHNMIEALRHATRELVVFSDSDALVDRAVLLETSKAFADGAEAVSGLPDASGARRLGDVLVCLSFNHYFDGVAIIAARLGVGWLFSGTWMGMRRSLLERIGGLEQFERHAADDFALADSIWRAGGRLSLIPRLVTLRERGGDLSEAARHILKWTRIVRGTAPWRYLLLPLATPLPLLLAAVFSGESWPAAALLGLAAWRVMCAWCFDRIAAHDRFPLWAYLALPLVDLGFVGLWVAGLAGDTIEWRGRRYRVRPGGLLESETAG